MCRIPWNGFHAKPSMPTSQCQVLRSLWGQQYIPQNLAWSWSTLTTKHIMLVLYRTCCAQVEWRTSYDPAKPDSLTAENWFQANSPSWIKIPAIQIITLKCQVRIIDSGNEHIKPRYLWRILNFFIPYGLHLLFCVHLDWKLWHQNSRLKQNGCPDKHRSKHVLFVTECLFSSINFHSFSPPGYGVQYSLLSQLQTFQRFRVNKWAVSWENQQCGFWTDPTQTRMYSHRSRLEAWNFGFRKKRTCTIRVAKTKALISFAVFVFAYANC